MSGLPSLLVPSPCSGGLPEHRTGGSLDLTPGPMLELGRKFQSLLSTYNQPTLMARRWAGQWDHAAIRSLQPEIARCTRKQIKAVLGHIGRVTSTTAATCWRDFTAIAKDLSPPRDPSPTPALTGARLLQRGYASYV